METFVLGNRDILNINKKNTIIIAKECLNCKRFKHSCDGVKDQNSKEITPENMCSEFLEKDINDHTIINKGDLVKVVSTTEYMGEPYELIPIGTICIVVDVDDEGKSIRMYPGRCKFRGFSEESNDRGYMRISKYMVEHAEELLKDCE